MSLAKEKGLDLIQMTENMDSPVCKIMDYGKFLYQAEKKERKMKSPKAGGVKGIRLTFNISPHDLEVRASQAKKFLEEGNKVKIDMVLRGREKALQGFSREKIGNFVEMIKKLVPIKIEKDLKREQRGFTMIIAKK